MFENQPCDTGLGRLLPRPTEDSRPVVLVSRVFVVSSEIRDSEASQAGEHDRPPGFSKRPTVGHLQGRATEAVTASIHSPRDGDKRNGISFNEKSGRGDRDR